MWPSQCLPRRNCLTRMLVKSFRKYANTAENIKGSTPCDTPVDKSVYANKAFKKSNDLLEFLMRNVLFHDENIIAFNKPAGLALQGLQYQDAKKQMPSGTTAPEIKEIAVFDVLQQLCYEIKAEQLHCAYSLQRQYSGVLVFSKKNEVAMKLKKHSITNKIHKIDTEHYLGVLNGIPDPLEDVSSLHLQKHYLDGHMIHAKAIPPGKKSKGFSKSTIKYQVVAQNKTLNIALVNIFPNTTKWDSIPVFFLHKLTPLLGDHVYGHCMATLMGQRVLPKKHIKKPQTQVLSQDLLSVLGLKKDESSVLPLHLHRERLTLPSLSRKSKELVISAPLPDFFKNTLQMLNLDM